MLITLDERVQTRIALARQLALLETLEQAMGRSITLPPDVALLVGQLAQSDDIITQFNAVEAWHEETQQTYRERLKEAAPTNLSSFAEFINMDEPPARHHEWMCSHLELVAKREILRMTLSMSPGHAKSTYCSHLFPAWYLGNHPNHKYLQAGHTQEFVDEEMGKKVRGIIDSEDYLQVFPHVRLDPSSKAAGRFSIHKHKGKYLGRGVGQGIAGFRGNVGAVDDPFASQEDAESQTIRRKVYDWFIADFTTRLLPRSPLFVVATRWHTDDLCGRLEELNKQGKGIPWTIINLPAIAEDTDKFPDPLGRVDGEPLWPEFYTLEHLLNFKATAPAKTWNALYQGKPMDIEGGTFKADWVRRYEKIPENETNDLGRLTKVIIRRVVVSVDSANKANERNDYTAITVWIEDAFRKHYLVDVIRKRLEFPDLCTAVDDVVNKWNGRLIGSRVSAILVEDKGSGTQYIQTQRGKAPAPVIAIEVGQNSKEFRFDAVTPMWEAGEVLLPESALWLPDYERELLAFPNGSYDDQVDSTSQYLAWARVRRVGGTKKLGGIAPAQEQDASTVGLSRPAAGMVGSRGRIRAGDFSRIQQLVKEYGGGAKIGG